MKHVSDFDESKLHYYVEEVHRSNCYCYIPPLVLYGEVKRREQVPATYNCRKHVPACYNCQEHVPARYNRREHVLATYNCREK